MKNISKLLLGVCLASSVLTTGCIDETLPTEVATADQLGASAKATEALLWAMPAYFNKYALLPTSGIHYDWGYGSIMHIRDVMTEDMPITYSGSGYDWYDSWETNKYQGNGQLSTQFHWWYYYKFVQTANNMISAVNAETANSLQLGYLGAGYAFRALAYLDMSQMYEFLPVEGMSSINSAGKDVLNLTVPIVKEGMTEAEARNNPRATREEMAAFILADLDNAEKYIENLKETSKTLPHLDGVYGLKARYYLWLGEYAKAKEYARKAIDKASVKPMTQSQCLSTTKGFNDLSCWMWGSQLSAEDAQVKSGIVTWVSWMSNETNYGYSSAEPLLLINRNTYERISNSDFRKKMWKAPEGTLLDGESQYIDEEYGAILPEFAAIKFRPNEGNMDVKNIGNAAAFPVMRVEEMYFIEAEAAAHLNAAEGKQLVEAFMKAHRDPEYVCLAIDVVEEIVFQKRVELWGEGLTFFDVKRLNMSVTRGYPGTNFHELARLNTNGRPAWMNMSIVRQEADNNKALVDYANPDPTDYYTPWIDKDKEEEK